MQISFQIIFYKITKIKIKSFERPKSIKSIKKENNWNIRLFDDDSFVPSSKQPSVIYCRLTDFSTTTFFVSPAYKHKLVFRALIAKRSDEITALIIQPHGGFQLEFISINWVINHMTYYRLSALIG